MRDINEIMKSEVMRRRIVKQGFNVETFQMFFIIIC